MTPVTLILTAAFIGGDTAVKLSHDNVSTITSNIGPIVGALAVIVGGIVAYYKFVRGRIYRPRVEVDLTGQWSSENGKWRLEARITVKNVGASKLKLLQKGTGLRVSLPSAEQPPAPASTKWKILRVFVILDQHAWIESGETVSDVLLLDLGVSDASRVLLEGRLVWRRLFGNIESSARETIPAKAN